ncbi:N-formylglutamate amidohydrolase [Gluconobacter kanchanaburiensis NBRC 103587]|nr:N-formylglutamate amidohydrolase [Gluconobacter kanchanaburiensis NBRC 103587]
MDAHMFSPPPPADEIISTAKVSAGFGVIPRSVSLGRQIYDRPLDLHEKEIRLARAWLPYHESLSAILKEMHARFGYAVLLEIHSMPPLPYARSPEIVLGDVHGKSCHPDITTLVEDLFEERKYTVRRNIPYSGGYITQSYGHPQNNIHALQIEICRSLYLNTSTLKENSGFSKTRKNITEILKDFLSRAEMGLLSALG